MPPRLLGVWVACATSVFAQSDRGTITGTIADPAQAVVANASIEARNLDTGVVYPGASTGTGNYTLTSLPAGSNYELNVTVPRFKKYTRRGLTVQVAQTLRVDITLEVGNASEVVTVSGAAPLLKTESGEQSHNVTTERLDNLPLLVTGDQAGAAGIRNPYSVVALLPGSYYTGVIAGAGMTVRINGAPNNTETILIDGQDATNGLGQSAQQQSQPGTDAIEEWAILTSNYDAQFGQAGGGIMNVTTKSGTNRYHGSGYDYFANEILNAGQPFTDGGHGNLIRSRQRRNDYGFTLGGPVWIPKIYDGRDKTFFFWNAEEYRLGQSVLPNPISVPTLAFRKGDFSKALLTNGANQIYNPTTTRPASATDPRLIRDPFVGNLIPANYFDPVALKVQALLPPPDNDALIANNYRHSFRRDRSADIPSLKIDQVLSPQDKLSFYWSRTIMFCLTCTGTQGLPQPIDGTIGTDVRAHTERVSYDRTVTPAMLLHLGAGYTKNRVGQTAPTPDYDACGSLGLCGPFTHRATFPVFQNASNPQGGLSNIGQGSLAARVFEQSTAVASLTWVKSNHTYKFGGQAILQGNQLLSQSTLNGTYTFSAAQTSLPYVANSGSNTVGGNPIGFPYASFLLGLVNTAEVHAPANTRMGKSQWAGFAQDTWKITRKLTLDYGLRYDFSTYLKEQYGRYPSLAPVAPNPSAGGLPGAVQYEATCGCSFAHNYPWAFGPRLGAAYRMTPATVIRAGFGVVYNNTAQYGEAGTVSSANNPIGPNTDASLPIMTLAGGVPLTAAQIAWPNLSPGYYPIASNFGAGPPNVVDQNAGRPARQYQWSIGVQREISRDLVVEAAYVGNRGIWWNDPSLVGYNYISQATLAANGLSLNNPADLTILSAPLNSPNAGRFQGKVPYAGFPLTATVAQSLRPFPQFNSGLAGRFAPLGKTWYDSLQLKATHRLSHGLDFTYSFTWAKELDTGGTVDLENRQLAKELSPLSRPLVSGIGAIYTVPAWRVAHLQPLAWITRDWQLGAFLQYTSGALIAPPAANATPTIGSLVFQNTNVMIRKPGVPLYTVDLNCHCYDPSTTFVLNKDAWENPAPGQFGSATFYNDYRQQRRPVENLSLARILRIGERASLTIRMEFTNVFNRTEAPNPSTANPFAAQTRVNNADPNSRTTAGFGFINTAGTPFMQPRAGQLVARIQF